MLKTYYIWGIHTWWKWHKTGVNSKKPLKDGNRMVIIQKSTVGFDPRPRFGPAFKATATAVSLEVKEPNVCDALSTFYKLHFAPLKTVYFYHLLSILLVARVIGMRRWDLPQTWQCLFVWCASKVHKLKNHPVTSVWSSVILPAGRTKEENTWKIIGISDKKKKTGVLLLSYSATAFCSLI